VRPSLLQIAEERSKETRGGSLLLEPDGLYSGLYVTLLDEIHSLLQDGDKQVNRPATTPDAYTRTQMLFSTKLKFLGFWMFRIEFRKFAL
jgi:hypothetical protein